jgi:DNA-binding NtrC family response regulator
MAEEIPLPFVDDEGSIRLTLPPLLERNGFQVTSAASVPEALNLIAQRKFQVLLTDLNIGHRRWLCDCECDAKHATGRSPLHSHRVSRF